jgi:hypothetical protein
MGRLLIAFGVVLAITAPLCAQSYLNGQPQVAVSNVPPQMPFRRNGPGAALPVFTTPRTYAINQPAENAYAYRGVNLCGADVVIETVTVSAPIATQPATFNGKEIPGVLQVTSASGSVNEFTGSVFLARTSRNFSSSPNPMGGSTRYVSIMALDELPKPCTFRLQYGGGN